MVQRSDDVTVAEAEVCRSGIESDSRLKVVVGPILKRGPRDFDVPGNLPAGRYRLILLMLEPQFATPGHRVFDLSVTAGTTQHVVRSRIDVAAQAGGRNRALKLSYPIDPETAGDVLVTLTPVLSRALLCGAVLEPWSAKSARTTIP